MSALVTDTHAVIWYLLNQKALSETARDAFERAASNGVPVYLPTISLVEICYLVEKGRLSAVALERVNKALNLPNAALVAVPLTLDITRVLSLITRDRKIQASDIQSIW